MHVTQQENQFHVPGTDTIASSWSTLMFNKCLFNVEQTCIWQRLHDEEQARTFVKEILSSLQNHMQHIVREFPELMSHVVQYNAS